MASRSGGLCSLDFQCARTSRAPTGIRLGGILRAQLPVMFRVFSLDLFCDICFYSGWRTAVALARVCCVFKFAWFRLADDTKRALRRRIAIIGTNLLRKDYWDRLEIFSESGYRLQRLSLPRPRRYPACVFDGSHLLYVLGGGDDENWFSGNFRGFGCAVDCFNFDTEMWTTEPNMPSGRLDFGACRVGKEILAIGGFCPEGRNSFYDRKTLNSIDAFRLIDGTWEARRSLQFRRYRFGLVSISSRVYVIGGEAVYRSGFDMPIQYLNSIEVITEAGQQIRTCTSMPHAAGSSGLLRSGSRQPNFDHRRS